MLIATVFFPNGGDRAGKESSLRGSESVDTLPPVASIPGGLCVVLAGESLSESGASGGCDETFSVV